MVLLSELKKLDYDRFIRGLFQPAAKRARFLAYSAFVAEIERIPHTVKEPQLALIKLAWWREVLEELAAGKPPRPHPVLQALHSMQHIDFQALNMILAQAGAEVETPPPESRAALVALWAGKAEVAESLLCEAKIPSGRAEAIGITAFLKRVHMLVRAGISPFPAAEVNPDRMGSAAYKQASISFVNALVAQAWAGAGPLERFYLKRAKASGYNLLQADITTNLGISYFFAHLRQKIHNML